MKGRRLKVEVVGQNQVIAALKRIEDLLQANLEQGADMADELADVRGNLAELGLDIDLAVTEMRGLRTDLEAALANAGVDEAARAEIMATIDAHQQKLSDALNPSVPVDPDTPHVDNTLPHELPA